MWLISLFKLLTTRSGFLCFITYGHIWFLKQEERGRTKYKSTILKEMKSNLKRHFRMVHDNLKNFKCNVCDKKFGIGADLRLHVNGVHLKMRPYKSDSCSKSFSYMRSMKSHVNKLHGNIKAHTCASCDKSFRQKGIFTYIHLSCLVR